MSWRSNGTRIERENGDVIAYMTPHSTEADARLAAAAPDLFSLCRSIAAIGIHGDPCPICCTTPHRADCGLALTVDAVEAK